jgi:DNA-binding CsgD family transcriptional regulator
MAPVPGRVSSPRFVGRTEQLVEFDRRFEAATEDADSVVVIVEGDAGVGKSRFVAEIVGRAERSGGVALVGACLELVDRALPFAPLIEALRQLARRVDAATLERVLGPARTELAHLVPEFAAPSAVPGNGPAGRADSEIAQGSLFEHVLGTLERLGEVAPALVVLEDLHWADRSTLDLIIFLARNLRDARVVLVATYRSDDLHRRHPLRGVLAELDRSGRVVRECLEPFSAAEIRELVAAICDDPDPDEALVEAVLTRSEGNAFFAEELLAATRDRDRGDVPLPTSLRELLLARVDSLGGGPVQDVLRVAAVIGSCPPHRLLLAATPRPEPDVLEGIRDAVEHQLLVADDTGYCFRHALLKEAIYDDLLPGERVATHARVATVIQHDPNVLDDCSCDADSELASHWFSAHDLPNALAAAARAGDAAREMYAYPEALVHFERALELWERVPEAVELARRSHVDLLRRASAVAEASARHELALAFARRALEEVDEHTDPITAASVHERVARNLWSTKHPFGEVRLHSEAAVALVPAQPPSAERAMVVASFAQVLMIYDRDAEALEWSQHAIEAARSAGARAIEGHARNTYGTVLANVGELDAGLVELSTARDIARETESWFDVSRAAMNMSGVLEAACRYEESLEVARVGIEEVTPHGLARYAMGLRSHVVDVLFEMGRWDEAEEELRGFDRAEMDGAHLIEREEVRFTLSFHRGDLATAQRAWDTIRAHVRGAGPSARVSPYPGGALAIASGDFAAAEDVLSSWLERVAQGQLEEHPGWLVMALIRAYADRAPDDPDARARAHELRTLLDSVLEPGRARRVPTINAKTLPPWADAELARADGRPDPAQWAAVAEQWEQHGRRPHVAYARFREGEAQLLAGGDAADALPALRHAHELATSIGIAPLREEIIDLARRFRVDLGSGGGRASAPVIDVAGLTARELEVLTLVAQGRTNRQIAEALYISVKTASVHVSNILMKLDAQNRGEAAAIARDRGLLAAVSSHG